MKFWWFNTVVGIRDGLSGTRAYWVNPWIFSPITLEPKRKLFWKIRFVSESLFAIDICWNKRQTKVHKGPKG